MSTLTMEQKLAAWLSAKGKSASKPAARGPRGQPPAQSLRAHREIGNGTLRSIENCSPRRHAAPKGKAGNASTVPKARARAKSHGPNTPRLQSTERRNRNEQDDAHRGRARRGMNDEDDEQGASDDTEFVELYWETRFRQAQESQRILQEGMQAKVDEQRERCNALEEKLADAQAEVNEANARAAAAVAAQREIEAAAHAAPSTSPVSSPAATDSHAIAQMQSELDQERDAGAELRFLNEILAQEVTEVKHRAHQKRKKLQRLHERQLARLAKEREQAEQQVGAQIEVMTSQLKAGLQKSILKIKTLETQLAEERARNS